MVSSALDATAKLGASIHHSIQVPAREIAGVVNGVKAALDTFMSGARSYGSGPRPAVRPASRPAPVSQQPPLTRTDADAALLHERREAGF
jgi:hypothetical protein